MCNNIIKILERVVEIINGVDYLILEVFRGFLLIYMYFKSVLFLTG